MCTQLNYAVHNWAIFPGNGKIPAIPNPHPQGSRERRECKGKCGLAGHGVHDATKDVEVVAQWWWGGQYAGANILGRVPAAMFVLDVDPRNGGDHSIAALEQRHEPLPQTLTTISGRGDGGAHLFYRRPPGTLSAKRLGPGLDLKTSSGYVVLAPSIHPDTGKPYIRIDHPVAAPPGWLIEQESRTGVRATLNNQQRRSARQPFCGFRLGSSGRTVIQLVKKVGAKIRGGFPRCFIEVSVVVAAVHVLFPPPATLARFCMVPVHWTAPYT